MDPHDIVPGILHGTQIQPKKWCQGDMELEKNASAIIKIKTN